jgi:hypothetical protein
LAIFTLGLVVNGVYGAAIRDYVFIGAAIIVIAYLTLTYPTWAAGRERYRMEKEALHAVRRRALIERITTDLGEPFAELNGSDAQAAEILKSASGEAVAPLRSRLERAREPIHGLNKEYKELLERLSYVPDQPNGGFSDYCEGMERKADRLQERLEPHLTNRQTELAAYPSTRNSLSPAFREGDIHCLACGQAVPEAPFCLNCGTTQPRVTACAGCGERLVLPIHLIAEEQQNRTLFCMGCGMRIPSLSEE